MAVDALADTLRAVVETVESTAVSGGAVGSFVEFVLSRRPIWAAQLAAAEYTTQAASTAPLWRWIRIPGPQWVEAARGTSMTATASGVGGLAVTAGIPLVVAIGSWVMLGVGYYEARQEIRRKGFMSGFSHGFTAGVLKWSWGATVNVLAKPFVIRRNTFDPVMDREEALGYNEGLIKGWAAGSAVPEVHFDAKSGRTIQARKAFRLTLRELADRYVFGRWSDDPLEARRQQSGYVIDLAAAGLKNGLIVPE